MNLEVLQTLKDPVVNQYVNQIKSIVDSGMSDDERADLLNDVNLQVDIAKGIESEREKLILSEALGFIIDNISTIVSL